MALAESPDLDYEEGNINQRSDLLQLYQLGDTRNFSAPEIILRNADKNLERRLTELGSSLATFSFGDSAKLVRFCAESKGCPSEGGAVAGWSLVLLVGEKTKKQKILGLHQGLTLPWAVVIAQVVAHRTTD